MPVPIRIGIAGIGRAGWGMHCEELKGKERLFHIAAACDILKSRRDMMRERYACRTYARIEDLIADPEIELVDIATRSPDHFAHAMLALKAGKHVFLEKPMCMNYTEARKLKAASDRSRGNLYIRHNRRFEPGFLHIREIIASGILGEVHEIKLARIDYSRRDDWQALKSCGGGQLLNWGPHIIDHALRFLDAPLAGIWSDLKHVASAGDAADHLKIVLRGTNGRVVDLEISGAGAVTLPEYVIWGSRGGLIADAETIRLRYLDPKRKLQPRKASPRDPNLQWGSPDNLHWIEKTFPIRPKKSYDIWKELYNAVRKNAEFPITMAQSVEVMRVITAAQSGAQTPRPKSRAELV